MIFQHPEIMAEHHDLHPAHLAGVFAETNIGSDVRSRSFRKSNMVSTQSYWNSSTFFENATWSPFCSWGAALHAAPWLLA